MGAYSFPIRRQARYNPALYANEMQYGGAMDDPVGDQPPPSSYQPPAPGSDYTAGGAPQYSPNMDESDPYELFKQDRRSWYDRGNRIDQDLRDETAYRRNLEGGYRGFMDTAAGELRDTPGYTPEEQAGIMREEDMQGLLDIDYGANYLTPDEQAGIAGNPYSSEDFYDPGQLERINNEGAGFSYDALNATDRQLGSNIDRTRTEMGAAIDPGKLGLSGEYTGNQDAVLNTTAGETYGAIDPERLRMSGEYARQAGMTDQEVADLGTAAARNVGYQYQASIDRARQDQAASGNASPLAMAAVESRMRNDSAVKQADALTDANIAARQAQRDAATGVEKTRLGAETGYAGLRSGAALDLGNMAEGAVSEREQLRQGAERDISNRQLNAAATTGQMGQDAAQYGGTARQNTIQQNTNRAQQTGQYVQTTGINMRGANEANAAGRSAFLGTNRQGTTGTNQANTFNRGFAANDALSQRTAGVGDARMAGRDKYLGWSTDQTNAQMGAGTTARGQRTQNMGTQGGLVNNATSGYGDYDLKRRGQSFGTNFKTGLASGLGDRVSNFGKTWTKGN